MATKSEVGAFRLQVPLDASGVGDFKPDLAVKVVVFNNQGKTYEDVVKLDAKGKGQASVGLRESPGNLTVAVGPEDATAEQMKGLQTISLTVNRLQWAGKKELTLAAVRIAPYYWWWWHRWCRTFTVTGVVRCADGVPVPGAKVCAYDVDWWWWWWSDQQVGCATTDEHGAFEIKFTWCCGWWPWWWWRTRFWRVEPRLAERITRLLREDLKLERPPLPGPQPDPEIFTRILNQPGSPPPVAGRLRAAAAPMAVARAGRAQFDPSSIESLRDQLVAKLPASTELAQLRLWPWWPWRPWWDCTPDLIFKVTQECRGEVRTIVDETAWDVRWNVPTNLNVTLVANENACCVSGSTCLDGGDCAFISNICEDNLDNIGGNPGLSAGAAEVGYLSPGALSLDSDRPYSGTIPLRGCVGDTVDYYEFQIATAGFAGPWTDLPIPAAGGFVRSYWDNALLQWTDVPFPFAQISDGVELHNVIESLPHWESNHGAKLWDAFRVNLLMLLATDGVLADGTYYLKVLGWHRAGYAGNLSGGTDLPVCGSATTTGIVVTIDNHLVTAGPDDLNGHPCAGTAHVCTTEPDTEVLAVVIEHNDGTTTNVGACGNVKINNTDVLQIDFVAHDPDPDPHLRNYSLALHYDINLVTNLLNPALAGWSLGPSPIAPGWAPPAAQVGPNYWSANPVLSALSQGASRPHWAGGAMRLRVRANEAFPYTCCYQLALYAHKRTIGGGGYSCDHSAWNQWNRTEYSFTITV